MNGTHPEIRDLDKIRTDGLDPKAKKEQRPISKLCHIFRLLV